MAPYFDSLNIPPQCPTCGSARTVRVKRKGILQKLVLHRFGVYPWECTGCRKVFTVQNRGHLRRQLRANHRGVVKLPQSLNGSPTQAFDF